MASIPCGPAPPHDITYSSLQAADEALKAHSLANGYNLIPKNYYPSKAAPSRVNYRCSKGKRAAPRSDMDTHASKRRQTSSQMTGCTFAVTIRRSRDSEWAILPHNNVQSSRHNHPWIHRDAFGGVRASTLATRHQDIVNWWNSGIRPREIVTSLARCDPPITGVTSKDVINLLAKHRRHELAGRRPIQWLYDVGALRSQIHGFR